MAELNHSRNPSARQPDEEDRDQLPSKKHSCGGALKHWPIEWLRVCSQTARRPNEILVSSASSGCTCNVLPAAWHPARYLDELSLEGRAQQRHSGRQIPRLGQSSPSQPAEPLVPRRRTGSSRRMHVKTPKAMPIGATEGRGGERQRQQAGNSTSSRGRRTRCWDSLAKSPSPTGPRCPGHPSTFGTSWNLGSGTEKRGWGWTR